MECLMDDWGPKAFCVKTLQKACMVIAAINLVLSIYYFSWAIFSISTFDEDVNVWFCWCMVIMEFFHMTLNPCLFFGAQIKHLILINVWLTFTKWVTFPYCFILFVYRGATESCCFKPQIFSPIEIILTLAYRYFMRLKVQEYFVELQKEIATSQQQPNNDVET